MDEIVADAAIVPVRSRDGAQAQLLLQPAMGASRGVLYWLPAMGVPARHYLPLAQALAAYGINTALHEWRGIGSSDRRASRRCDWGYREVLELDLPAALASLASHAGETPRWIGGHSLGGQLACLYASRQPTAFAGLALVASGSPYWRRFPGGWMIGAGYTLAPLVAAVLGHFPGRRLGFGGNEARRLIADWARSGRRGVYAARGMPDNFERALATLDFPVLGLRLHDDWLAPAASLDWLLAKMPQAAAKRVVLTAAELDGRAADHFAWMKAPGAVAAQIAAHCRASTASRDACGERRAR